MTGGRWVAVDADTGTTVIIGRPGHSRAHVRRSALDDYGIPHADLRLQWRPDVEETK